MSATPAPAMPRGGNGPQPNQRWGKTEGQRSAADHDSRWEEHVARTTHDAGQGVEEPEAEGAGEHHV